MQKLSNLVSQQWFTPPRNILTEFHQNQLKIGPVLEKSTLQADFDLALFEEYRNLSEFAMKLRAKNAMKLKETLLSGI